MFRKRRKRHFLDRVELGDVAVIPQATTIDTLYVMGGTVCNNPPILATSEVIDLKGPFSVVTRDAKGGE